MVRKCVCLSGSLSIFLSVCYHVFCNHAQRDNERAMIPRGSALHRLDFKIGDFIKSNVFESYGVKTIQYAIFPPPDFVAVSVYTAEACH